MKEQRDWEDVASKTIKELLKKEGINYNELSERLKKIGIEETYLSISGKINRGTFAFVFMLEVLESLNLQIDFIKEKNIIEYAVSAENLINKENFVKAYAKLNKISRERVTIDSSDLVLDKLTESHKLLLTRIGISKELQESILNDTYDDWSIHNQNLTTKAIEEYYDFLVNEQRVLDDLNNLIV